MPADVGHWIDSVRRTVTVRRIVYATLALSALAVAVVLAVMLPGRRADPPTGGPADRRAEWATAERLVLPRVSWSADEDRWEPSTPRRERWSHEEIGRYWVDPAQIGFELLDRRVEERIRRLLEEVP